MYFPATSQHNVWAGNLSSFKNVKEATGVYWMFEWINSSSDKHVLPSDALREFWSRPVYTVANLQTTLMRSTRDMGPSAGHIRKLISVFGNHKRCTTHLKNFSHGLQSSRTLLEHSSGLARLCENAVTHSAHCVLDVHLWVPQGLGGGLLEGGLWDLFVCIWIPFYLCSVPYQSSLQWCSEGNSYLPR